MSAGMPSSSLPQVSRMSTLPTCKQALSTCLGKLDKGEECDLLPTPKRLFVPSVPPGTFVLSVLRKGVWVYNDGLYLTLIMKVGTHLALVDFPDSPNTNKPDGSGTRLSDATEQVLGGTIPTKIDMIYSHAHLDHIGTAVKFYNFARMAYPKAKIEVWGSKESRELAEDSTSNRAVAVTKIVGKKGRTVRIGGRLKVNLRRIGGHTQEDLAIYIARDGDEKGILMFVDVVFPKWAPTFNLAITQDVRDFIEAQEELLKLDFDVFVSGHFQLGSRRDMMVNLKYAKDLVAAGATALKEVTGEVLLAGGVGRVEDPSDLAFGNIYFPIFSVLRKLQVDICTRILLEKWGCRLGGLDLAARGHCFISVTYNANEA